MHALRGFIAPVLYWPLLLWFISNLMAVLLQFWNFAWSSRWERNACDVKKRTVKFPFSKRSFSCVYKKHFSPISSKSLSNCREINQKSLVAYTEELNSHLRHTYRDKCGERAPIWSLENTSLCVNYSFLSNYLRNQTRILRKCTACRSLACTICVKWKKKRDWPKML